MTDSRLHGADFIRATACLLVLSHHLGQRLGFAAATGGIGWVHAFAQIGTFGVAMFFVLSGFLLARPFWQALDRHEPMPSLATYALRRAARIVPGFWLALWMTFIVSITLGRVPLDGQLVLRALAGMVFLADWHWVTLFPVEFNGPLWSISMEVTSYVLMPLGLLVAFGLGRWPIAGRLAWVVVIAAAVLAHLAFVLWYPIDEVGRSWDLGLIGGAKTWMPRFNPFGFCAMFAIGVLAASLQVWVVRWRSWVFDALALLAIAAGLKLLLIDQLNSGASEGWGWLGVPYGFPWFPVSVGVFLIAAPQSRLLGWLLDNPPVRYLARISFGIYVWHYLLLEIARMTIAPNMAVAKMDDPTQFLLISALVIGAAIIIADLSFRFLETPVIRWARGLERKPVS